MNIVCLNCEVVVRTEDPRKKFCGEVCRNRFNVRKTRSKPKKEKVGAESLREMIKRIENKSKPVGKVLTTVSPAVPVTAVNIMTGKVTRGSISRETYQKDEWIDP